MLHSALRRMAVTAAILALTTTACGTDGDHRAGKDHAPSGASASVPANAAFNGHDVAFATMMIGHHQQAVEMAKLAPQRAASPKVKALAAKIQAAQQPEIDTMSGWLKQWKKPVPDAAANSAGHGQMPGMMTESQLQQLRGASGTMFDNMFLTMMIAHHEGAIVMSQTEQKSGKYAEARALAVKVGADQTAEITEMKKLLQSP